MYELRELGDHYFGLYLILILALLALLKFINPWRLRSLTHFWVAVGHNEELNKPFKVHRAFSILTFVFRSLVFGLVLNIFQNKSFYISSFDSEVLYYAGSFMIFWVLRAFLEGGFMSFFHKQEALFRIFHIRTLNKEKMTFLFGCLLFGFAFVGFGEIASLIFVSCYAVAVLAIHLNMLKLYFRQLYAMPVYIILYICASEIAPLWLALQILKF